MYVVVSCFWTASCLQWSSQGSLLGPLLFIMFMNDLFSRISSNIMSVTIFILLMMFSFCLEGDVEFS
ncbi:hypothetical protein CVS40_12707 [Lucilia cuprina]|nr:hypothetical protein CVS40_12707 [Lucilia cuprina]